MATATDLLSRRILALVLAGLYALSLTGSFLHQVLVQHVRCAEHGDLVHMAAVDAGHPTWTIEPDGGGPDTLAAGAVDRGHSEDHDHDHCMVVAFSQTPACTSDRTTVPTPRLVALPPEVVDPGLVWRGVLVDAGRYRLAPKGSPPV